MKENNKKLNIAVIHDHLSWGGGGERTALIMALGLEADFITAYASQDTFPDHQKQLASKLIVLTNKIINLRGARFFYIRWIYFHNRKLFKKYDLLIASGQSATEAVAFYGSASATKISYTHTQPRRVYDLYEISKKMYPLALQPLFMIFAWGWKNLYLSALNRLDVNIANSKNVRRRAIKYTNRDVNYVVWPPILTEKFNWLEDGDYFLSWARTDEAKRIELIVEAFQKMPDKKLVIASGGPRLEIVKAMAKDYPNIKVLGWVSDQELFELVGKCRAAIYIPIDEDAGMTPLEANSAGKVVLGVNEGGLKEIIINNKTGLLISASPQVKDIIKATEIMTTSWCQERKENCIQNAKDYDKEKFLEKIEKIINEHDPRKPILGVDASRWEDPHFPKEHRRTGVEIYSYNVIKNLSLLIDNNALRLRLYTQRPIASLPMKFQKILPRQKNWSRKILNKELKTSQVNYFFTPSYYIPKNAPENSTAVIHDVIFKSSPEKYKLIERLKQNYVAKLNLARAKKIITVSNYSKKELIKYYDYSPENIISIPMGHTRQPIPNSQITKEKMLVYIGRIEKKKSIDILIKAFARLQSKRPDWQLHLAGMDGYGAEEIDKLIKDLKLEKSIKKLGYISEDKKFQLLNKATILIHPSSEEGSCLPMFEAWETMTATIVTDNPLFREIANNACLFFKSFDVQDLSKQIELLINDKNLRDNIIKQGQEKLKEMSWDKTAAKTLDVLLPS